MADETTDSVEEKSSPEAVEAAKRQSRLNLLILGGVFLLGVLLPQEYKAFAPLLFIIPVIVAVVQKVRRSGERPGGAPPHPPQHDYSPPMHDSMPSGDFYGYEPKDPKDPRRYKPIG